jgi:hypothetical protein
MTEFHGWPEGTTFKEIEEHYILDNRWGVWTVSIAAKKGTTIGEWHALETRVKEFIQSQPEVEGAVVDRAYDVPQPLEIPDLEELAEIERWNPEHAQ